MCRSETASVVRIWNFEFRRILFEQKDEPFLAVERAVRQAVKERAMYKIKLFGDDGRADE